ncbi:C-type lectin domain family 4 member M-like [Megalobrama amblycephala]|uniref:C-type lectin domain family 4 member M-like n=1 Tax=Megalobrama amblycephala TaxID=75352 RepID=UPI002014618F|nr:C-type lectin domain family 4 member M-like [Megalobrama amblycephala]
METDIYYVNFEKRNTDIATGPPLPSCNQYERIDPQTGPPLPRRYQDEGNAQQTRPPVPSRSQDEVKAQKCRGSRCLVLMTVCLGIICVLLLVGSSIAVAQYFMVAAERESLFKSNKNTVEEFNQTINRLQHNYTELMTEKDQLKNNFTSLSQKKLELESNVTSLSDELQKAYEKGYLWGWFFISNESKSWSDSRKYCRDQGADLVIIKSEEKQRYITSLVNERMSSERVWIGLTDIQQEGNMKWVDNSILNQGFWDTGEPNNERGNENCVELMPSYPVLNWNDLPCSIERKGICEK